MVSPNCWMVYSRGVGAVYECPKNRGVLFRCQLMDAVVRMPAGNPGVSVRRCIADALECVDGIVISLRGRTRPGSALFAPAVIAALNHDPAATVTALP